MKDTGYKSSLVLDDDSASPNITIRCDLIYPDHYSQYNTNIIVAMGCAGSKQEAHKGNKNPGRTRNRYSDSDSPSRAQLPPPKPVKREDAFNHGRPQDSETVPAGWSRSRHVNEPTRSRTDRGTGFSLAPPTGYPGYVRDRAISHSRENCHHGF